jgi:hypothetical protein
MSVIADSEEIAKSRAEELISDIPLIQEISSIKIDPYTDHSGDAALQLTFRVRRDVQLDDAFWTKFLEFSRKVQTRILHSNLDRFPYTSVEQN